MLELQNFVIWRGFYFRQGTNFCDTQKVENIILKTIKFKFETKIEDS